MTTRLHRGKRSKASKEERLARKICFQNSFRTQNPDEIKETILVQDSDFVSSEVLALVKGERETEVPICPRGLVLSDNYGEGFFDVYMR